MGVCVGGGMNVIRKMVVFYGLFEYFDQGSFALISCVACERNRSSLSCRQFFPRQKLVRHRFAAICGTGVQHPISRRLCRLTFARVLLEHIVHQDRWRRQLP